MNEVERSVLKMRGLTNIAEEHDHPVIDKVKTVDIRNTLTTLSTAEDKLEKVREVTSKWINGEIVGSLAVAIQSIVEKGGDK